MQTWSRGATSGEQDSQSLRAAGLRAQAQLTHVVLPLVVRAV